MHYFSLDTLLLTTTNCLTLINMRDIHFDMYRYLRRSVFLAGLLLLCFTLLSWSMPAQANTNINQADTSNSINSQLEAEVLQIIRNHPEVIREALQAEQQQQQQQQQQAKEYIKQLLQENHSSVIGESPVTGATEKKIVLIEFSDFQCPYCAKAHKTLKQFIAKHKNEVTLVYKHYPLNSIHPEAIPVCQSCLGGSSARKVLALSRCFIYQARPIR